jgi:hypothetical protein
VTVCISMLLFCPKMATKGICEGMDKCT